MARLPLRASRLIPPRPRRANLSAPSARSGKCSCKSCSSTTTWRVSKTGPPTAMRWWRPSNVSSPMARPPSVTPLRRATRSLAVRPGERRLVLFTDGRDTCSKSTATPARLAEQLRQAEIQSFAIGLRSQELDASTLSALANRYAEADVPHALGAAFTSARQHLAREMYRFILLPRSTRSGPGAIQVTVGGN